MKGIAFYVETFFLEQINGINSKLEQILPQKSVSSMRVRSAGGVPPRRVIVSRGQDEDQEEDEEDFSEVEEEMMNLFRKITSPLRRVRQRKFSVDKLESDIAAVKYKQFIFFLKLSDFFQSRHGEIQHGSEANIG